MPRDKKTKSAEEDDQEITVRALTELRQDTTEKSQKAMERRIALFDKKRERPFEEPVENAIAKAVNTLAELAQNVRKLVPEGTMKSLTDMWTKLMLAF